MPLTLWWWSLIIPAARQLFTSPSSSPPLVEEARHAPFHWLDQWTLLQWILCLLSRWGSQWDGSCCWHLSRTPWATSLFYQRLHPSLLLGPETETRRDPSYQRCRSSGCCPWLWWYPRPPPHAKQHAYPLLTVGSRSPCQPSPLQYQDRYRGPHSRQYVRSRRW